MKTLEEFQAEYEVIPLPGSLADNLLKEGKEIGRKEGRKEGKIEGKEEGKEEGIELGIGLTSLAIEMLCQGYKDQLIGKKTGLTIEQIQNLRKVISGKS